MEVEGFFGNEYGLERTGKGFALILYSFRRNGYQFGQNAASF